jgi:hypothetical protein
MNSLDAENLACIAAGIEEYSEYEDIDAALYEKFDVDLEQFTKIAEALLILTPLVETAIGGDVVHAFVKENIIIARRNL